MLDWLIQAIDNFTTRFLGMSFSLSNFIVLGVFFLFGFYFGKLTKNMTFLKFLLFLFLGLYIYAFLHAAHFMIIAAFISGMIANHGRLILRAYYWAYDLKDVLFALKNRKAFDDIRRREEELEERIRQFKQEKAAFAKEKASKSCEKNKSKRQEKPQQSKSKTKAKSPPKPKPSSYKDKLRAQYLRILGLNTSKSYNSDQIRKAYRTMVKKTHPDVGGSEREFIKVANAYEWLKINSV